MLAHQPRTAGLLYTLTISVAYRPDGPANERSARA